MAGPEDPILPIIDRKTPVLDRVRGENRNSTSIGKQIGRAVGKSALNDNEEEKKQQALVAQEEFRSGLAAELGVPEEAIDDKLVAEIGTMFMLDDMKILTEDALQSLGLEESDDASDEEDDEDENDSF